MALTDAAEEAIPDRGTYPLGKRPPLRVADLPEQEEVFGVGRLGTAQLIRRVLGPSLIALGISIGSGEWLLGPLNVGTFGFRGIGWIILVSALLQVAYNIEVSRYVIATGETPIVGFGRVPPGPLVWIPFSLLALYFANIWGGWVRGAAQGLFALVNGRIPGEADTGTVLLFSILLLLTVLALTLLSRRISRALQITNLAMIGIQLLFLLVLDLLIVPWEVWRDALVSLVTPALPPSGSDATLIGGLVGFTALASGLNWYALGHYRDQGYGMGHRVGYLSGMLGERKEVQPVGYTFPDDAANAARWKRWMHYLKLDQWIVFFGGAMLGMFLPIILMRHLVLVSGQTPTQENVVTFAASILGEQYGLWPFYLTLLVGFLILFDTQLGIFEALVRNATDSLVASPRLYAAVGRDPRRFYYPFMVALIIVIFVFLRFFQPATLVLISANMSNFGALVFPFALMYLNSRLPRAAKPRWWSYALLVANFLFFGFFFVNFVVDTVTGTALVQF
jgi:hypothetical protein